MNINDIDIANESVISEYNRVFKNNEKTMKRINKLIKNGQYNDAAKECDIAIDQLNLFRSQIGRMSDQDMTKVKIDVIIRHILTTVVSSLVLFGVQAGIVRHNRKDAQLKKRMDDLVEDLSNTTASLSNQANYIRLSDNNISDDEVMHRVGLLNQDLIISGNKKKDELHEDILRNNISRRSDIHKGKLLALINAINFILTTPMVVNEYSKDKMLKYVDLSIKSILVLKESCVSDIRRTDGVTEATIDPEFLIMFADAVLCKESVVESFIDLGYNDLEAVRAFVELN